MEIYDNENDISAFLQIEKENSQIMNDSDMQKLKDTQYSRDRKLAYGELNQFELQFNDFQNDTTTWLEAIQAIKDKYPKPE